MKSKNRIVIKLGGSSLQNQNTLSELTKLIQGLRRAKNDIILVHGGGPAINEELTRLGITWQFIGGQRQTTLEMIAVIEDVLSNKINGLLVETLSQAHIPSRGISGASDTLICSQLNAELMQVGQIENVNTALIEEAIDDEVIPVIAPIGIGSSGEKYNINADWAAAQIAIAIKADELIFLTDQDGVLDQDKNLIPVITPELATQLIESKVIFGGMFTKVNTMMTALNSGLKEVRVLNAHKASEFLIKSQMGTLLIKPSENKEEAQNVIY